MRVVCHAASDVGRKRKGNEDSLAFDRGAISSSSPTAWAATPRARSPRASRSTAIREFVSLTAANADITWPFGLEDSISYDGNRLKTAIRHANRRVLEAMRERAEYEGMATTVVAVLVEDDIANIAHVGDSRIYLWSGGELQQLTSDHSWVNEQIHNGIISRRAGAQPPAAQRGDARARRPRRAGRRPAGAARGAGRACCCSAPTGSPRW